MLLLSKTTLFAVEAECHSSSWKISVVMIPSLAVGSVPIDDVAITSQRAKRWKRVAHTNHGER